MTKFTLAASLFSPAKSPIAVTINGHTGKVMAMECEDGSGRAFNVKLSGAHVDRMTFFVRTVD